MKKTLDACASWLRRGPASAALAVLLLVLAVSVGIAEGHAPLRLHSSPLALDPSHPKAWAFLTAWAGTTHLTPLVGVVVLLTIATAVEHVLGTRRYLVAAAAGHVVGCAAVLALAPLVRAAWPAWGAEISKHPVSGISLLLVGPVLAVSARLSTVWRRRLRVLVLVGLALAVAVAGTPGEAARLAAALTGLAIGAAAWRRPDTPHPMPYSGRATRTTTALLVVAWALTMALTIISSAAVGPLSGVRNGLLPTEATGYSVLTGTGSTLLALMPLVLQLVLAEGLRHGRRAAWIGTIALQALFAATSIAAAAVAQSLDGTRPAPYSARWLASSHLLLPVLLDVALIAVLVWNRAAFRLHTRERVIPRALVASAIGLVACCAADVVLGTVIADSFKPEATPSHLFWDFVLHLLPASIGGFFEPWLDARTDPASAVTWLPPIVAWLVVVIAVWVALAKPAVTRKRDQADLARLIHEHGASTLGWMLTWPGNETWISDDGETGFAYRAGSGVALTLADPAAAPERIGEAVEGFASFAADAGLVPALYSVHEPAMLAAREHGWTVLQVAEEAVIDLPDLAFRGKAFQDVRTALNHAEREGITAVWTTWREAPAGRQDQIRAISQGWSDGKALPEMGFTLGGLTEIDDEETRLLLAVDSEGTVHAVTSWMPVYEQGEVVGLTLDVMRKREGGWRPSIEYLIGRAAQDAKEEGLRFLSLSGAPLARTGTSGDLTGDGVDDIGASRFDPVLDLLGQILEPAYGFSSLHSFKRKFKPRYVPLYLAIPDAGSLAAVGLAIGRAYVPDMTAAQAARFAQVVISRD